jgi:hypothetical protein
MDVVSKDFFFRVFYVLEGIFKLGYIRKLDALVLQEFLLEYCTSYKSNGGYLKVFCYACPSSRTCSMSKHTKPC